MRVCVLTTTYPLCQEDSMPSFVASLCEELVAKHHLQVDVVAPHAPGSKQSETINGVKITRFQYAVPAGGQRVAYGGGIVDNLRRSWRARLQVVPFLAAMFKVTAEVAAHCDIIHAHWVEPGCVALAVKRLLGKPLAITIHRFFPSKVVGAISNSTLRGADMVLFNSYFTKSLAHSQGITVSSQVHYIGVDVSRFQTSIRSEKSRQFLTGLPADCPVVLTIARLVHWKGTIYLLRSFKDVVNRFCRARLVIAGHGPELEKLKREANALGLDSAVLFLGPVPHSRIPQLLSEADVFALPSIKDRKGQTETLGVSTIEAMLAGLPCVGSRLGGIPEVIENNITGFLVPAADSQSLASGIIKLLASEELRERMGRAGRERAEKIFSLETYASKTLRVYRELVEARTSG